MRSFAAAIVFALALLVPRAAVSASQPRSSQSQDEIIVTGHVKDALRNFVQSLSKEGPTGQIARWDGYICPTVVGIDPGQAQFMEQRILQVGHSLRLRPGGSGCITSLIIVITPAPDAFVAALIRDYPFTLRADGSSSFKSFANSSKPVRWISVSDECGGGCELPNSRLVKATKPTLQAMVVVVDAGRIGGYSLGELSDYLALVGLSNPPADAKQPTQSILSMFERPRAPGTEYELTAYDTSFLSGLYETALDDSALRQRTTILSRMRKDVGEAHPR